MTKSVSMRNVLPHTYSSIRIGDGGGLIVSLYDCSEGAHRSCGGDIEDLLIIDADNKERALAALAETDGVEAGAAANSDERLLELLNERRKDYFDVRDWLESVHIPYHKVFNPWP